MHDETALAVVNGLDVSGPITQLTTYNAEDITNIEMRHYQTDGCPQVLTNNMLLLLDKGRLISLLLHKEQ